MESDSRSERVAKGALEELMRERIRATIESWSYPVSVDSFGLGC
jgi:hypothetical protein